MSDANRSFDGLVREFYEVWFRFHPEAALEAGVSGWAGRLPAADDDDAGALVSWLESSIVALEELDFHALDDDRQLDARLLFGTCRREHQGLLEADWRHRNPLRYLPGKAVHQLVLYPQAEFRGVLERLLEAIPAYLRHGRAQLRSDPQFVPAPWVAAAAESAQHTREYLLHLGDSPQVRRHCDHPARVQALCEESAAALSDYARFLDSELAAVAAGQTGCGEPWYREVLARKHFLDRDLAALERLARLAHDETLAALRDLSERVTGDADPNTWLAEIAERSPLSCEDQLELARAGCEASRAFVLDRGLARIPREASMKVAHSPGCLTPGACVADYVPPPPGDPNIMGTIYLTAVDRGLASRLPAVIAGQCLRRGWPGRHLQAVVAAVSPAAGSIVRRLNPSATLQGGWPLYAEQLMIESGFRSGPEDRLALLLERLRRSLLAVLDLEVHLHGLDPVLAAQRLAALPGVTADMAGQDVLEVTLRPGEGLAMIAGWRLINALREHLAAKDTWLDLAEFHGRLLAVGPVAARLAIGRAFGPAAWEDACVRSGL